MQSIIEEKITKLSEELNNINVEPEEEINMENIKEINCTNHATAIIVSYPLLNGMC